MLNANSTVVDKRWNCLNDAFLLSFILFKVSQVALVVKNSSANAGDTGFIPGSGRSLGEGNDNPLQYSCLGNAMDRGV